MISKMFLATALTLTASLAIADQMGPNGDRFYDEAAHFVNACSQDPCKAPYSAVLVYNQSSRLNKLTQEQTDILRKVAFTQAQIWGDTILEGDFHSAGRTRLDSAVAFFKGNKVVGFKIRYSEKAWNTSECAFDGTKASLKGCVEGRIAEESFVSPDFFTFFTDEDRQADFSLGVN
ncbi:hypothetical protein B9G69_016315 [Bdellovibrio sp. SKB1291214]|uniref:hypothetical protein n=1 Tax=Bdellovibrio sp. SKB1291214 TaxID=1732569 RepID=UPI002240A594|nr:hypothetical protein [Bdellovibrio sp. SKB1291214]UYL08608.1 hypothetical protein B9G69_016315 [Bdellovibrio sp. SKB1291214]